MLNQIQWIQQDELTEYIKSGNKSIKREIKNKQTNEHTI